jgi:hypothetical protein
MADSDVVTNPCNDQIPFEDSAGSFFCSWLFVVHSIDTQRKHLLWHHDPKPYMRERCTAMLKIADEHSPHWVARCSLLKPRDPVQISKSRTLPFVADRTDLNKERFLLSGIPHKFYVYGPAPTHAHRQHIVGKLLGFIIRQ